MSLAFALLLIGCVMVMWLYPTEWYDLIPILLSVASSQASWIIAARERKAVLRYLEQRREDITMTDNTNTLASVERFLKIERINHFIQSKRATLTFSHGGIDFPITTIDTQGHVIGETEGVGYRIEMSNSQLEATYTYVVEQEEEATQA
jgi:hypothetical protein